jgi:hypothetical protein
VGLILYAVLVFFGLRGMPVKQVLSYFLLTALLGTILGVAAIDEQPACEGLGCTPSLPSVALAFLTFFVVALLSYGFGAAVHTLVARWKRT